METLNDAFRRYGTELQAADPLTTGTTGTSTPNPYGTNHTDEFYVTIVKILDTYYGGVAASGIDPAQLAVQLNQEFTYLPPGPVLHSRIKNLLQAPAKEEAQAFLNSGILDDITDDPNLQASLKGFWQGMVDWMQQGLTAQDAFDKLRPVMQSWESARQDSTQSPTTPDWENIATWVGEGWEGGALGDLLVQAFDKGGPYLRTTVFNTAVQVAYDAYFKLISNGMDQFTALDSMASDNKLAEQAYNAALTASGISKEQLW